MSGPSVPRTAGSASTAAGCSGFGASPPIQRASASTTAQPIEAPARSGRPNGAIAQAVKVLPAVESASYLAVKIRGYGSLQAYRQVVKEALRIGTFLRLQVAGVDTFDSALAQKLLDDLERIVLTVAAFDKKAVEEALKEKGVPDDELEKWVTDLPGDERRTFEAPNRTSLIAVGIVYDDFDRAKQEGQTPRSNRSTSHS